MLFSISYQLCKEFSGFTPFIIDDTAYHKVIGLYGEVREMQINEERINDPNRVIRRPAGDNWF